MMLFLASNVRISNVIMLSHQEKIITFLSIPAAVGSDGLPIGQYFLYKLIAQQKDVGYKNLLRTDLVTQVRQETINRKSELYENYIINIDTTYFLCY